MAYSQKWFSRFSQPQLQMLHVQQIVQCKQSMIKSEHVLAPIHPMPSAERMPFACYISELCAHPKSACPTRRHSL